MKKLLLVTIFMWSSLSGMEDEEKGITLTQFDKYYDHDTKTLNLRNLMMGDSGLQNNLSSIKQFINLVRAENLILEKNNLQQIPYHVITFALINRSLRYVSMKENNFNIALMLDQESSGSVSLPLDFLDSAKLKSLPKDITKAIKRNRSTSTSNHSALSSIATSIWEGISPEIEKALVEHNSTQDKKILYKKIIIIDKNIPPITIIDNERLPKSKLSTLKNISIKLGLILIGVTITLLPNIVDWIGGNNNNPPPTNSTITPDIINPLINLTL